MKPKTQHIPPEAVAALIALPETLEKIFNMLDDIQRDMQAKDGWKTIGDNS